MRSVPEDRFETKKGRFLNNTTFYKKEINRKLENKNKTKKRREIKTSFLKKKYKRILNKKGGGFNPFLRFFLLRSGLNLFIYISRSTFKRKKI